MHFTQLRRSFLGDSVDYEIIMVFDTAFVSVIIDSVLE